MEAVHANSTSSLHFQKVHYDRQAWAQLNFGQKLDEKEKSYSIIFNMSMKSMSGDFSLPAWAISYGFRGESIMKNFDSWRLLQNDWMRLKISSGDKLCTIGDVCTMSRGKDELRQRSCPFCFIIFMCGLRLHFFLRSILLFIFHYSLLRITSCFHFHHFASPDNNRACY